MIAGSPKTITEKIIAYHKEVGPFGHFLVSGMGWEGQNGTVEKRSMEMLAREVMSDVNRALEGKV